MQVKFRTPGLKHGEEPFAFPGMVLARVFFPDILIQVIEIQSAIFKIFQELPFPEPGSRSCGAYTPCWFDSSLRFTAFRFAQ